MFSGKSLILISPPAGVNLYPDSIYQNPGPSLRPLLVASLSVNSSGKEEAGGRGVIEIQPWELQPTQI